MKISLNLIVERMEYLNPVIIVDSALKCFAHGSFSAERDPMFAEIVTRGYVPEERFNILKKNGCFTEDHYTGKTLLLPPDPKVNKPFHTTLTAVNIVRAARVPTVFARVGANSFRPAAKLRRGRLFMKGEQTVMKVADLRETLKVYDRPDLCEIVVELYKAIPKHVKEERLIDAMLSDFGKRKQLVKKQDAPADFASLRKKILLFADFAEKQYYFAPNQYVHKKDRPKWRFITKRYVKALTPVGGENAEEASDLLILLYRMLSYACQYYLFNTEDPFASVGYAQTELLRTVLVKVFHNGVTREAIRKAVTLTIESGVDRVTLHIQLFFVLIECLKTNEAKELAAEACIDYNKNHSGNGFEDGYFQIVRDEFRRNEIVKLTAELYFHLKAKLREPEEGIAYYWKNNKSKNTWQREVELYVLLELLKFYALPKLWLAEYEKAAGRGVEPRESLQYTYKRLKEGLSFSEMSFAEDDDFADVDD
jgi:hypothetical protein